MQQRDESAVLEPYSNCLLIYLRTSCLNRSLVLTLRIFHKPIQAPPQRRRVPREDDHQNPSTAWSSPPSGMAAHPSPAFILTSCIVTPPQSRKEENLNVFMKANDLLSTHSWVLHFHLSLFFCSHKCDTSWPIGVLIWTYWHKSTLLIVILLGMKVKAFEK